MFTWSRRSDTIRGRAGFAMSMIRAAPTRSSIVAGLKRNANSSNSIRYGWPLAVIGIEFWGLDTVPQVIRLIWRTCGAGRRRWTAETSRITRFPLVGLVWYSVRAYRLRYGQWAGMY